MVTISISDEEVWLVANSGKQIIRRAKKVRFKKDNIQLKLGTEQYIELHRKCSIAEYYAVVKSCI
jgi:hypothetical protein